MKLFAIGVLLFTVFSANASTFSCFSLEQGDLSHPQNVEIKVGEVQVTSGLGGATYKVRPVKVYLSGKLYASFDGVGTADTKKVDLTLLYEDMALGTLTAKAKTQPNAMDGSIRISQMEIELDQNLSCIVSK
jgi:hypothetical protein